MNDNKLSRLFGAIGLIGCVIFFFVLKNLFPKLAVMFVITCMVIMLLLVAVIAVVMIVAFKKPENEQIRKELNVMLLKGREQLVDIRRISMKIKDRNIRAEAEDTCRHVEKVLRILKEQPENLVRIPQLFDEYMPTLQDILSKYVRMEEQGCVSQEEKDAMRNIIKDMKKVMEEIF